MILLIDTSQETGFVALESGGDIRFAEENKIAKEHAVWLHEAVRRILKDSNTTVRDLEAVAVVAGPGSYTGLRVGMAAAKGFCYALKIPLITRNSLFLMADAMKGPAMEKQALICPMIDARREEVFTALYKVEPKAQSLKPNTQLDSANGQLPTANCQLSTILPPQALILNKSAFEMELSQNPIIFTGSGVEKWKRISESPVAIFESQIDIKESFAGLSRRDFQSGTWADPVYSEPVYLKEFFSY